MSSSDRRPSELGFGPSSSDSGPGLASAAEVLRAVVRSIDAGLVLADVDGRIVEVNERFASMLGYEPHELIGVDYGQITHAEDVDSSRDALQNAKICGDDGYRLDKRYRRKDGTTCWARLTLSIVRDSAGTPRCNVGVIEDLTSARMVEEQLRFQAQLLDNVSDSVVATDLEGRVTYWGRGAESLYGYSADEVMGQPITFIVRSPEEKEEERERMATVHRTGSWSGRYPQRRRDGSLFWADTFISLARGANGEPFGYIGIDRDITDRVLAENALRRSEEKFRVLAENIREVFWMSSLDEPTTIFVSPAYEEIWGRSCESLYENPHSFLDSIHPEDRAGVEHALQRQLAGEQTVEEYRIIRPNGSIRWIRDRGFPVIGGGGGVARVVGIAEDITEPREAEERRRQLEARVEHAQRLESLGVLAGGIAHDFNNLLTGILGNVSLGLARVPAGSFLAENLSRIQSAGHRAAELTNLMLAYSGRAPRQTSNLDLSRLVSEMAPLVHAALPGPTSIRLELAPEIRPIDADVAQLRQVVMNLITNAGEAMSDDAGFVVVTTGVMLADHAYLTATYVDDSLPVGEYVFLEVADRGCGMDRETVSRIFDPFFTTKFTGRGLGLAAVLGIVRGHKGAIRIDSRPGEGTTIRVLFPPSRQPLEQDEAATSFDVGPRREETVLVVDDESLVRATSADLLRHCGYSVLEAASGSEALQILREAPGRVTAVLLDLTMPEMDGQETFRRIRAIAPELKIFLCSGYSEVELAERFGQEGFAGFLQKPFRLPDLLSILQEASGSPEPGNGQA